MKIGIRDDAGDRVEEPMVLNWGFVEISHFNMYMKVARFLVSPSKETANR